MVVAGFARVFLGEQIKPHNLCFPLYLFPQFLSSSEPSPRELLLKGFVLEGISSGKMGVKAFSQSSRVSRLAPSYSQLGFGGSQATCAAGFFYQSNFPCCSSWQHHFFSKKHWAAECLVNSIGLDGWDEPAGCALKQKPPLLSQESSPEKRWWL